MPRTRAFLGYCQKMPKQCFELQALPQLLSENDKTIPQTAGHFLSYCQKMPKQCFELGAFPSTLLLIIYQSFDFTHLHPLIPDSAYTESSVSLSCDFYSSWKTDATTWHFCSWCVVTDIITIIYFCDSFTNRNFGRAPQLREVACPRFLYTPGLAKFGSLIRDVHQQICTASCRYAVLSLAWHYRKAFDFSWDIKRRKQSHDNWAPVTTAGRVLRLRMEERPPIWRVAANILNN